MYGSIKRDLETAKKKVLGKMDNPGSQEKLNEIVADEIEYEALLSELAAIKRCAPLEKKKIEMLEAQISDMERYLHNKYSKGIKIRRTLNYISIAMAITSIIISLNTLALQRNIRMEKERKIDVLEQAIVQQSLGNDELYDELINVSWYGDKINITALDVTRIFPIGQAIEYYKDDDFIINKIKKLVNAKNFEGKIEISDRGSEVRISILDPHLSYTYSSIFKVFDIYGDFRNIITEIRNVIRNNALRDGKNVYWISNTELEINYDNEMNIYTLDEARIKFKDNPDLLSEIEAAAKERSAKKFYDFSERNIKVYWHSDNTIRVIMGDASYKSSPEEALEFFKDDEYIVYMINELLDNRNKSQMKDGPEENLNKPIIEIPAIAYDSEQIRAFEKIYNTLENELVYDEAYAEEQKRIDNEQGLTAYETKQKDIERTKTDKKGVCTTFAMRISEELDKLGITNYLFYSIAPDGLIHWSNLYLIDGEYFVADITEDIVQGNYAKQLYGDFDYLPALSHNVPLFSYMKKGSTYFIVEPIVNDKRKMSEYSVLPIDVFINSYGEDTSVPAMGGR